MKPPSQKLTSKKKILVISPVASHPQNCGNRTRIYNLLSSLKKMGHEIHFLYYPKEEDGDDVLHIEKGVNVGAMKNCWDYFYLSQNSISLWLQKHLKNIDRDIGRLGIFLRKNIPYFNFRLRSNVKKISVDAWYPKCLDKKLAKLRKTVKFHIVIVEYTFLSKALESFDKDVLKIIDTHDKFGELYKLYERHGYQFKGIHLDSKEETRGLKRADIIIAIQENERDLFSQVTDKEVVSIGHIIPLAKPRPKPTLTRTNNILFVGAHIPPNEDGVNNFIQEIFPKVRSKLPDAKLIVAGAVCKYINNQAGVIKLGEVKDIKTAYQIADVVISPVRFGSGLKIKSIEALAYSKPLITTSHGVGGLEEGAGRAFLVADDTEKFAQSIINVLTNINLYNLLSHNASNFVKKYNQRNINELKKVISYSHKNYIT